jgi:putative ABC transport system ATP-binding protein
VAIARSLANDPAIILADEPTGNVDSKTSAMLIELLRRINQEKNATLIVVTHDPLIAAATNRVVQMLDGQIVGEKDPKSLLK